MLDLGGARFQLDQREIKRRDRVFWHLFSSDVWAVSSEFYALCSWFMGQRVLHTNLEFHVWSTAKYISELR
jgi:hypothetical protein